MKILVRYCVVGLLIALLGACSGGPSSGSEATDTLKTSSQDIYISGTVTFDLIPHSGFGSLDYTNIETAVARGVTVQLLNSLGAVVSSSVTDTSGQYRVVGEADTDYRLRVLAEMTRADTASWNFRVTDNTNNNAIYALEGESFSSRSDMVRDLYAESGWTGNSFGSTRAAAPFAILDAVYQALEVLLAADANLYLLPTEIRWSINNRAILGTSGREPASGDIGSSYYSPFDGNMYLLGQEDDPDEYDRSVIQHELAHYLEDTLSRSDNIGGSHNGSSADDIRLVFSEGFANAFTGYVSGDGTYYDSTRTGGFYFSLESRYIAQPGWYNEFTIGQLIYDLLDDDIDGVDHISLPFSDIYRTITNTSYIEMTPFISVYSFLDQLTTYLDDTEQLALSELAESFEIYGLGPWGEGETNDAGIDYILPVYALLTIDSPVFVCTSNRYKEYNGIQNRRYLRVNIQSVGNYQIHVSASSTNASTSDPDAYLYQNGAIMQSFQNSSGASESGQIQLVEGDYVMEVFDNTNVDNNLSTGGSACFNVSLSL